MKATNIFVFSILILVILAGPATSDPNNVKTTVYAHDKDDSLITGPDDPGYVHEPIISRIYTDGLGREIQSRVKLPDNDYLLVSYIYDDIGRKVKTLKSTIRNHANDDFFTYETPELFHYSETRYDDTPLSRVKGLGAPGREYSLDPDEGHPTLFWYFGVAEPDHFIPSSDLRLSNYVDVLDSLGNKSNAKYFLTVTKHPNDGSFSQEITDIFGNVISTWADPDLEDDTTNDEIVAINTYYLSGNIAAEAPPEPDGGVSLYTYNTLGQLVKKETADAGDVTYEYDQAGQLIGYTDENLRKEVEILENDHGSDCTNKITIKMVTVYDKLGRVTEIKKQTTVESPCSYTPESPELTKTKNIYDHWRKITTSDQEGTSLTDNNLKNLKNTRGRLIYSYILSESDSGTSSEKIATAFSYDEEGNISKKYLSIPGLALQTFEYTYDLQGKVLSINYTRGRSSFLTEYKYNHQGLVEYTLVNGIKKVGYTYSQRGLLDKKDFYQNDGETVVNGSNYTYNVRDWVNQIRDHETKYFVETINYANTFEAARAQYNGNVGEAQIAFFLGGDVYRQINSAYFYDKANRLKEVVADDGFGSTDAEFSGLYAYDRSSRFIKKNEGSAQSSWENYEYYPGTNRLKNIDGSDRYHSNGNFIYDGNGNMILDRSKNMVCHYDWRDMPVEFVFYETIKDSIADWDGVIDFVKDESNVIKSRVKMMYDSNGNRVLKRVYDH